MTQLLTIIAATTLIAFMVWVALRPGGASGDPYEGPRP